MATYCSNAYNVTELLASCHALITIYNNIEMNINVMYIIEHSNRLYASFSIRYMPIKFYSHFITDR